jgi:hypothetical protein
MAKRFLTPIGIVNLASDPATGSEGEIYYNSTDDILKIYVNGSWTPIEGGGGAAINVSASAPIAPEEGDAWFDNTDGKFYVYDGSFWVETGQTDAVFSSYNRWTKVISASTVNITGLDDNSTNLSFTPGLEQVYINGVFIDESSYTATSGSAIVLDEAVLSTDLVEVLWLENLVVADTYSKAESDAKYLSLSTASSTYLTITNASATYATQADLDNIDLTSTINTASAAAVNFLVDGAPEALNTLNELAAALEDNADILDLYLTQSSASSIYATQAELAAFSSEEFLIKAEAYTAVAGDVVFVNSASGAYTVTLPASPTLGDRVRIIDLANNAATNNITAGRNGNNIDGSASNFTIDINNAGVEFIYTNATYGWRTLNG